MRPPVIILFFLFFSSFAFCQKSDSARTDTLRVNSDLILIKKNNHIINSEGKEKFHAIWIGENWSDKQTVSELLHSHQNFFNGFSSEEIIELFGMADSYGRYPTENTSVQQEYCWIQFIFREDKVYATLFPCS